MSIQNVKTKCDPPKNIDDFTIFRLRWKHCGNLLFPRLRNEKKTDEVRTLSGNREAVAAERAPDIRGGLRNLGWIKKVLGI
jgi:hypothetical protein